MLEVMNASTAASNLALGTAVIDLRGATTEEEIFRRIGSILRGAQYLHDVNHPNFDMLQELVEDWFDQSWGSDKTVIIRGVAELLKERTELMLETILMISRAEMWTLEKRARASPSADSLTPYLSLRVQLD